MKRSGFKNKPRKPLKRASFKQKGTSNKRRKSRSKGIMSKAALERRRKGIWSTAHADAKFSLFIRERDGKCLKCGTTEDLTCSHYHRRGHSATRFYPQNCITLCKWCHAEWEGPKNPYTQHMIDWLGMVEFTELALRAGLTVKRVDAVKECKDFLSVNNSLES